MKIYNTTKGILLEAEGVYFKVAAAWDELINDDALYQKLENYRKTATPAADYHDLLANHLMPPMNKQEIWASGVTYFNSKMARQEESEKAGGGTYYEKVYHADRPELFFKATAHRTVPSGGYVRIREDSNWNVPEPELTLVLTSSGKIVGYTIGNDMSSRSIEGENPLYLPQAKTYDGSASVGPCVLVSEQALSASTRISMKVFRKDELVFEGTTDIGQMKRKPEELVHYLFRECSFPHGCLLMTGTGIVPSTAFTLASKDEIQISIDAIGTLINTVQ